MAIKVKILDNTGLEGVACVGEIFQARKWEDGSIDIRWGGTWIVGIDKSKIEEA